jgi:hypothetical protein
VFKRWALLFSVAALLAMVGTGAVAQKAATPTAQDNVAKGEAEVKQLLPLMDQDKQGKVSKEEFMKFMAAEFDSTASAADKGFPQVNHCRDVPRHATARPRLKQRPDFSILFLCFAGRQPALGLRRG